MTAILTVGKFSLRLEDHEVAALGSTMSTRARKERDDGYLHEAANHFDLAANLWTLLDAADPHMSADIVGEARRQAAMCRAVQESVDDEKATSDAESDGGGYHAAG